MNHKAGLDPVLFSFALLAFFLSLAIPSMATAASGKTRMAVIDFEQKGSQEFKGKQVGEMVAEWLITSLVNTGRFEVVERAQLQKILQEQQLGVTGMISQETAAKVGELLGVKVIITGSVIQLGNNYDVNARLISVEDGSILKAERIRCPGLESIETTMDSLANVIKKDFPLEGFVVMVGGRRVMIDLGKNHGVEPGMKFLALRKGAPVRHPVTGKMLMGEDIKLGEIAIQTVDVETAWGEILQEEPGAKIAAGNVVKQIGEETVAMIPKPAPVTPAPRPSVVLGRWRSEKLVVDWNGDGLYDLILGDRDGFVTLYLNQGTNDSPRYGAGVKLKAGGQEIKVRSPSAPCLVDWNEDGKKDLLVGNGGGYLHLFLNPGSGDPLNFAAGVMVQAAGKNLDVGSRATPIVVDWNEDGKKDLVLGNGSGEIFLYLNEGTNDQPVFGKPNKLNGGSLDVGSNSSPDMVDWNGDGKKDLIVGNSNGEIFVFLNKGTNEDPKFDDQGERLSIKIGRDIFPQVMNRGRGLNDLVVADRDGEVALWINSGSPGASSFSEKKVMRSARR